MNILHELILKVKIFENNFKISKQNTAVKRAFVSEHVLSPFERKGYSYRLLFTLPVLIIGVIFFCIFTVEKKHTDTPDRLSALVIQNDKPVEGIDKMENRHGYGGREIRDSIFDYKDKFVVLVNKRSKELLLLKNHNNNSLGLIERFSASIGKASGDKQKKGDLKTPEGIYKIVNIKYDEDLTEIYGPMAFVLDYPNKIDKNAGKTGSDIWIHGTGMMDKITPDTRGCVEISDRDILKLSKFIGIETPVVIIPETYNIMEKFEGNFIEETLIKDILSLEAKI